MMQINADLRKTQMPRLLGETRGTWSRLDSNRGLLTKVGSVIMLGIFFWGGGGQVKCFGVIIF